MRNTVKVERIKKDITQAKLAELIGASRQTIYSIEGGDYVPSVLIAMKLSFVFNVPMDEIFSLEENDWC